jgi:polyhydroxybutyrate depolymerase
MPRKQPSNGHWHPRFVVKGPGSRFVPKLFLGMAISLWLLYVLGFLLPVVVRAQDPQQYVNVNGTLRTFVVHLPIGYDPGNKYPVVILLHSTDETAQDMARLSRFDFVADRYGFIAFYPNSEGDSWDIGAAVAQPKRPTGRRGGLGGLGLPVPFPFPGREGAQGRGGSQNGDRLGDVAFIDEMLDKLTGAYSVDSNRIFATGYSDGGLMDFRLGCSMSRRIAAIAPVAAAMPKEMSVRCKLSHAVPLLMMNGTSDPVVHYGGGKVKGASFTTLSVQTTVGTWAELDRCNPKPTHTTLPLHDERGMKTRLDTYSNCRDGAEVALYTIEGGGNTWPSGDDSMPEKEVGKTSADLDADEVIWKFFSAHPMPSPSSAGN